MLCQPSYTEWSSGFFEIFCADALTIAKMIMVGSKIFFILRDLTLKYAKIFVQIEIYKSRLKLNLIKLRIDQANYILLIYFL
jgi:hypothetical protein